MFCPGSLDLESCRVMDIDARLSVHVHMCAGDSAASRGGPRRRRGGGHSRHWRRLRVLRRRACICLRRPTRTPARGPGPRLGARSRPAIAAHPRLLTLTLQVGERGRDPRLLVNRSAASQGEAAVGRRCGSPHPTAKGRRVASLGVGAAAAAGAGDSGRAVDGKNIGTALSGSGLEM